MKAFILSLLVLMTVMSYAQTNEKDLRDIIAKQEADWNKNDMSGYTNAFTEDATLINFLGFHWKGKSDIINQFKQINDCCIKPTQIRMEFIDAKFLGTEAAVAYIKEMLTAKDDYVVPGGVVKKGSIDHKLITAVFQKQAGTWKIVSMQVTQVNPIPPR